MAHSRRKKASIYSSIVAPLFLHHAFLKSGGFFPTALRLMTHPLSIGSIPGYSLHHCTDYTSFNMELIKGARFDQSMSAPSVTAGTHVGHGKLGSWSRDFT